MIFAIAILIIIGIGYCYTRLVTSKYDKDGVQHKCCFGKFFYDGYDNLSVHLAWVVAMCIIVVAVGSFIYVISMFDVASMEAFYDNTLAVYEYTVDKSENITINAVKDAEKEMNALFNAGNFAYFELAKEVNENLKELREEIKNYNQGLYSYRRYNDFWLTDSFVPAVPERLKPIKLK